FSFFLLLILFLIFLLLLLFLFFLSPDAGLLTLSVRHTPSPSVPPAEHSPGPRPGSPATSGRGSSQRVCSTDKASGPCPSRPRPQPGAAPRTRRRRIRWGRAIPAGPAVEPARCRHHPAPSVPRPNAPLPRANRPGPTPAVRCFSCKTPGTHRNEN